MLLISQTHLGSIKGLATTKSVKQKIGKFFGQYYCKNRKKIQKEIFELCFNKFLKRLVDIV